MFGMGTGSGPSLEPPGRPKTDLQAGFLFQCRPFARGLIQGLSLKSEWAWEMRTIKIERAIRTGKLNASWSSALTHPAYQRDGLSRLLRENSSRGGFLA